MRTFYPADPVGVVPGGVDTFIRGIIKFAPEDFQFSLVGMTTDAESRPRGKWTRCRIGQTEFDFFPAVRVPDAGKRSRIPLSLRFVFAVSARRGLLRRNFEVFEFHRIEPVLLFQGDGRPKNAFFHTDMSVIRDSSADILWKYAPKVYDAVERRGVASLSSVWSVRADAVESMRCRYPMQRDSINFISTWVDTDVFYPLPADARARARNALVIDHGLDPAAAWVVSVGRLDLSKDPEMLVAAVARQVAEGQNINLLMIGDGVLRSPVERSIQAAGIGDRVRMLGLRSPEEIARILASSDVFALSSAYEGMPMALLEALGCGLPVATTDVGEIRRVVQPGINGAISADRSREAFSACLKDVLVHRERQGGAPALRAIERFRPAEVLQPVYENYRQLADHYQMRMETGTQ